MFHLLALLALCGGDVIADQVQFGDFTYSVNGDSVIIMDYPESAKGTVVIPDTIKGKPVTSIGNNTFAYCAGLTNITIPDSVTKISDYAFNQCTGLTSVYFKGNAPKYGAGKFSGVDTKKLKLHIYEGSTGFEMAPWDIHPKIIMKRPAK